MDGRPSVKALDNCYSVNVMSSRLFNYIKIDIPFHRIMKRLGYSGRSTEIDQTTLSEINGWIERAADLISLKALARIIPIAFDGGRPGEITFEDGGVFKSAKLASFLEDSDKMLMMGVTGGLTVAAEIASLQKEGRMTEAVVIDAAASEIVDGAFDWLAGVYANELRREGRRLTKRRFSAGYGDFELENQREIYKMLGMERIDVNITGSCILMPEKSVTAVYGLVKSAN